MTTATLDPPLTTGPIHVELGTRVVTDKRDYFPYPRQSFPIDRKLLGKNGYGEAAMDHLEAGRWITTSDLALTGPDLGILEFPDGSRYSTDLEFLGGQTVRVTIVARLPNAIR